MGNGALKPLTNHVSSSVTSLFAFSSLRLISSSSSSVLTPTHLYDTTGSADLKWKTIESNKRRVVHQIEKIDNFQGNSAPILRFRTSFEGPCHGAGFANFIMDLEQRKKWDVQIENVYEAYPIHDLEVASMAMGFKYGVCSKLGVGHCQTKSNMGIDSREQLTLCGIQEFPQSSNGSCIIWGTEMEEWHNHLLEALPGPRCTRAKSHIFCTTLVPTGPNSFDVEYVLQLDIGGNIPTWLTTPIVTDSVKKMFGYTKDFFLDKNGELTEFLAEQKLKEDMSSYSLLMTP